ncbi:MAG TPA: HNH endonuclease domain-containing protein [Chitinophagales bacterium]|nr:HNH endonuclease domain-containing protein [Chitinophagales bacterium]
MSAYVQLPIQKRQARERGISPYEPDTIIPLEELFTDKYDLDHIVPKSKIFETGYANLVLCRKELNKLKNRKLASDFVKSDLGFNEEKWKEVAEKFGAKKQFLLMQEVPTDWISKRQNSDYNTKCFGTLATVNIPNKLINKFAKEWQLQKYDEQNMLHYLYIVN